MKHTLYISSILAACMLLFSCAADNTVVPGDGSSKSAVVNISLSTGAVSRANGALPTDNGAVVGSNEGTLNHICVGLFDTNDKLVTLHEYDYSGNENISTRTDAVKMLVFANVPVGAFAGKYVLSDFYTVAQDLGYTTSVNGKSNTSVTTANSQSMKSLPMMSDVQALNWASGTTLNPIVTLNRLVARVALTSLTKTFSGPFTGCSFTPTEVFIYNASNQLTNWNTKTVTGNVSGENIAGNANTVYLGSGTISTYSDPYYFYVFPHGSTSPTKLVIKGTFKTSSNITYTTYYPIIVNSPATGNIISTVTAGTGDSKISENTTYGLAVTINGTGVPNVSDELTSTSITVTTSVDNLTSATVPEYFGPKIGDIFYSDGSYSSTLVASKTPVAIVFNTTTSAADKAKGFMHGYAMALKNASTSSTWGPINTTPTGAASTTLNITDYDGLTYTGKINSSTYPAAYAAATTFKSTVPNPNGTSGWYLPSIGQWYLICINLGGMSTSFTDYRTSGYLYWAGQSTACASALNIIMNKAGSGKYDTFAATDQYYWCSSEYDVSSVYNARFTSSGYMHLYGNNKGDGYYVRAVLAF